ncbi:MULTISPECIES: Xaa-Pro peptidase family protein [unclassified Rhizobium]|uniref:M24 family metallopeptidase n=1 Tax=unclassified Rhizobium TaxID=2613769 RepID=UPI000EA89A2D|nr:MULTISPECIES: Xaa-Pro peptidase family protein [unclassified Rhizobium]AYG69344.1 aminopeptidase P family protein [Rhizobium sp. CCGE531]AYG75723.1 aminopeptidase P family protein [Rhizobium sp. CCGE532]
MFPRDEYDWRIAKAHAAMDAAAVDLLLIDSGELLAWLTGYTVSETMYRAALLPRHGQPWFILRELDEAPCREKTWITDVIGFADTDDPHRVIADSIRNRGFAGARIGVDVAAYSFSADTAARLQAHLPKAHLVALPGISDRLRWIKSAREIAALAEAAAIADKAMRAILQNVRVGSSTRAAAATAAATFLLEGADTGETGPIVKASGNHEFLHGAFKGELLGAGDILHVELIPRVGGYGARLMRPIAIGDATPKLHEIAARVVSVQDEQIEAMRPGIAAREVDAIVREGLKSSGLRPNYDNVTAYTLGLYTRTPRTSDFSRVFLPNAGWQLEEGMVFHVYATAARLGFSETVVVTPKGGRRLTTATRRLLIAGKF